MSSWFWTEQQLVKCLESNPALRLNEKLSQPAKKSKKCVPKNPRVILPPMKFYEVEQPVRIWLPFTYPSLNKTKRMNQYAAWKAEREFRDAVRWELILNKIQGFRSLVRMEVTIFKPVLRHKDRDNFNYKWLKDAIKGIVIIDDDPRYVYDVPVEFAKGKEHMEVRIIPIEGMEVSA
jgi:Holliday junction resolvase RusA-like endonuclease